MTARTLVRTGKCLVHFRRNLSSSVKDTKHYRMVVIGCGTGGCSVAYRSCKTLGAGNVAIVEPADYHYYQPLWTLVGAGIKTVNQSARLMKEVMPKMCVHHKEKAVEFDPDHNRVTLSNSDQLSYDYLVIGMGMQLNYHKVDGLIEALKTDPMVCSNYRLETLEKTFPAFQKFKGGNAIFTFPNTLVKCAGAPQKIMYLADEYWRKSGVRDKADIMYNSSQEVIFGVKKYAEQLMGVVQDKNITLNFKHNLSSIDHNKRTATFDLLDSDSGEQRTYNYDFIHVTPPMSAPDTLKNSTSPIVDSNGYLDVNKFTMQHNTYPNVFGLGDCTNVPTGKTAAAIAAQNKILHNSVKSVMAGKTPDGKYDGYTSCPLITGYSKCILAEFDFNCEPLETFPVNQSKQRRTMFLLKRDIMPEIYWKMLLKGYWSGPAIYRKMMHLGTSK